MHSLLLAVNVVIPLIVYMLVGVFIRKCNILYEEHFKKLNEMIFRILIPLTLFFDVYSSEFQALFQPGLYLFTVIMIVLVCAVSFTAASKLVRDKRDAVTIAQGIFRSNYVLFGGTIAASLCGESGKAVAAALAVIVVPLFNMTAVIFFETLHGGKVNIAHMILRIFQNPLVDAGILGAIFNLLGVPIPEILKTPLMTLGSIATPLALVTLGGLLSLKSMISHTRYLLATVVCRLVVVPMLVVSISIAFGFRQEALVALFAVFASPTAVSSTPMAQSMGGNGELAGEIVVVSSIGSILTIFLFVVGMAELGVI